MTGLFEILTSNEEKEIHSNLLSKYCKLIPFYGDNGKTLIGT